MPNFTPGPYCDDGDGFIRQAEDNEGHRLWVAQVVEIPFNFGGDKVTTANLNLFKAAPELYADALDTEHAYSWLMQELRDLQHDGASWAPERIGLFADSLIAYCDAHQIGTRAALAKADGAQK